ncbi:hypothetical protein AJ79_08069 [Helicocarpus griseus UAMH5409]|uniref:Protection of telomeres protein 1 n=1 Tax=Helicocarpus griseus UAMH5409 TaxID=1447875 RepID=A0A2B7WNG3_9EURO|nr:hypothetical protein AJ79_08069 [Helicocarpus griseus UAMH5409]
MASPSMPPGFDDIQTALSESGRRVNIIAAVVDALEPKLSGGTSYVSTFTLKDNDFDSGSWTGLKIRYFCNEESYLPVPEHGDVVLLRKIMVRQYQGAVIGLSSQRDLTPWIIFRKGLNPRNPPRIIMRPQTRELTSVEKSYALSLMGVSTTVSTPSTNLGPRVQSVTAATPSRPLAIKPPTPRGRPKFSLIEDLLYNTFVDLVVQVVKTYPEDYSRFLLYVTDYTQNKDLFNYALQDGGSRGGDEYGYTSGFKRTWPGPYGQMTLQVTLWEPHCHFARQNIKENDFVLLQNVNIKMAQVNGYMEGTIHTDRLYPDKIKVIPVNDDDDEDVKKLVKRKIEYWKRIKSEKLGVDSNDLNRWKTPDGNENQPLSRNARKRLRRQQKKMEGKKKRDRDQPEIATSLQPTRDQLNANIRAQNPAVPCTSINDILSGESHINTPPSGEPYRLPFQNLRYKASVRVVDFFPHKLEDFAVQYDIERAMLSDSEGSLGSGDDDDGDNSGDSSPTAGRRTRWEWRFCLLVEDAGPGTHYNRKEKRERMKLYVADHDAECLLSLDAVDLRADSATLHELRERLFILWGDLEERKSEAAAAAATNNDNDDNSAPMNNDANNNNKQVTTSSSRPFTCCIKEFGVKSPPGDEETDGDSDSDSDGFGWERHFRLFGTTIIYND